mmetsp:Transcript_16506/g.33448  ORF Transcript_16506/g.33448 Transcript_16506/m.33448 type:complete len:277 (+) Transcript_16506:690-1520(+)
MAGPKDLRCPRALCAIDLSGLLFMRIVFPPLHCADLFRSVCPLQRHVRAPSAARCGLGATCRGCACPRSFGILDPSMQQAVGHGLCRSGEECRTFTHLLPRCFQCHAISCHFGRADRCKFSSRDACSALGGRRRHLGAQGHVPHFDSSRRICWSPHSYRRKAFERVGGNRLAGLGRSCAISGLAPRFGRAHGRLPDLPRCVDGPKCAECACCQAGARPPASRPHRRPLTQMPRAPCLDYSRGALVLKSQSVQQDCEMFNVRHATRHTQRWPSRQDE